jgi:nucleotide-binding universal stress UspA family protein
MLRSEAKIYLGEVASRLQSTGLETERAVVVGEPAERIIEFAHAEEVGLILLSSHGRSGLTGWNISSVVQKVALRAYTAMMIVRAYRAATEDLTGLRYKRPLVALDGSQRAECTLPLATQLAGFHRCRLLVAHVVRKPEMPRHLPFSEKETALRGQLIEVNRQKGARYLEEVKSRLLVDVETRLLLSEHPAEALHNLVDEEEVDLVLLSAHGYSGNVQRPYGNTALNLIAYGTTPLIVMQDLRWDQAVMTQAERAASQMSAARRPTTGRQPVAHEMTTA